MTPEQRRLAAFLLHGEGARHAWGKEFGRGRAVLNWIRNRHKARDFVAFAAFLKFSLVLLTLAALAPEFLGNGGNPSLEWPSVASVVGGRVAARGSVQLVHGERSMTRSGKLFGSMAVASIAAIAHQASADRFMGSVESWGYNVHGSAPAPADLTDCTAIQSGVYQTIALRADGSVRTWGWNAQTPPSDLGPCLAVACGEYHSLALRTDRSVRVWGNLNNVGQLDVPTELRSAGSVIAIGANGWSNGVVKSDGTIRCWGNNQSGQQSVPANASPSLSIGVGYRHYLVIKSDRSVVAWGAGTTQATDEWNRTQSLVPVDLGPCAAVSAGGIHSLALKTDGTVRAWGDNSTDQCAVPAGLGKCSEIAAGGAGSCALRQDGTVVAWGKFYGDGPYQPAFVPTGLGRCVHVAMGHPTLSVIVAESGCEGDLDHDGSVTGSDISLLLLNFGPCSTTP